MSIQSMRKEIHELRNSILYRTEPACRAFVLGAEGSSSEEDIEAYREAHPHTHIVILYRRDCGERSPELGL